jgi:predicted transcriptional regulator
MKLPITEKFLWTLYNIIETLDRLHEPFAPRTMKEAFYPELYKRKREWGRKMDRKNFAKLIHYLKKKGWIRVKELEGKKAVILTSEGLEKVFKIKHKFLKKEKRKDKKWLMVIFDIPEKKKKIREIFREYLKNLGYQKFQKSIWICPYEVLKETQELIRKYSLERYVRILLVEEI